MPSLRLRVRIVPRQASDPALPDHAEREGEALAELVRDLVARGGNGAVLAVVRPDRTELVDLGGLVRAKVAVPLFLAGLTRSVPDGQRLPLAVGLAGRFRMRTAPDQPGIPVGVVFLEWADCRWWHWRSVLGADGAPVADGETVWRADDGDPLPPGLGRWWSLGRRTGNVVTFGVPDAEDPEDPHRTRATLVH
ncbi:MAG: hypothetical protein R3F59_18785 [Myxococcota bacterium]